MPIELHKTLVQSKNSNVHEAHTLRNLFGNHGVRARFKAGAGSNSHCLIRRDGDGSGNLCGLSVYDGTWILLRGERDARGLRHV